jgi:hypothetical protein
VLGGLHDPLLKLPLECIDRAQIQLVQGERRQRRILDQSTPALLISTPQQFETG